MASRPIRTTPLPLLSAVRLRDGIAPIWLALGVLIVVDVVWLLASPIRLSPESWRVFTSLMPLIFLAGWGQYRLNAWPRLQLLGRGFTFMLCAWPALRLFNHLTMSAAFPLADSSLAAADAIIGFDWTGYLLWLDMHPTLLRLMDLSYSGLTGYTMALFMLLLLGHRPVQRSNELLVLFFSSAVICSAIGMLLPAEAAAVFHNIPADAMINVDPRVGAYHIDHLQALRSNPAHMLDLNNLPGLVTFPSFHTAMGVIAIYCARGTAWLFGPSLVINLLMIASTPLFGSHYLVDIAAGGAIATGVIMLHRRNSASAD